MAELTTDPVRLPWAAHATNRSGLSPGPVPSNIVR